MKLCLISAPTTTDILDKEVLIRENAQRMPLNVLSLASIAAQKEVIPSILDLDRIHLKMFTGEKSFTSSQFIKQVVDELVSMDTKFFGFSSICSSYPFTLRIINSFKNNNYEKL